LQVRHCVAVVVCKEEGTRNAVEVFKDGFLTHESGLELTGGVFGYNR